MFSLQDSILTKEKELKLFFKWGLRRGTRIDIQLMTKRLLGSNSELNFLFLLTSIISNCADCI